MVHGTIKVPVEGTEDMVECEFMYDTASDELIQIGGEGQIKADDIDIIQMLSEFRELANMAEAAEDEPE